MGMLLHVKIVRLVVNLGKLVNLVKLVNLAIVVMIYIL